MRHLGFTGTRQAVKQATERYMEQVYIDDEDFDKDAHTLARHAIHLEQQAARLANLPGLPRGWKLADDRTGYELKIAMESLTDAEWQFLAEVLNVCYPTAPGQDS